MQPNYTPAKKSAFTVILFSGLLVGVLDILAAVLSTYILTDKNPLGVLRFIASGVFGAEAFQGDGNMMMVWGLIFHFAIAYIFTLLFFMLYKNTALLRANNLLTGIAYGIFIWLVMSFIVLPLSHTPKFPLDWASALRAILILICMIGLPLAFIMRQYIQ